MKVCPDCGKRCYAGASEAKATSRTMSNKLRVYFHRECGCWHVTAEAHPERHYPAKRPGPRPERGGWQ